MTSHIHFRSPEDLSGLPEQVSTLWGEPAFGQEMAAKLTKKLGVPLYLSYNLPDQPVPRAGRERTEQNGHTTSQARLLGHQEGSPVPTKRLSLTALFFFELMPCAVHGEVKSQGCAAQG